jgi:N-acetylated-alpha-linked acidic dipeptidase
MVSGVLIYTDPAEDGNMTIEAGLEPYPHGPARQPSACVPLRPLRRPSCQLTNDSLTPALPSVQRGSVQFLSIYPGDPLTPFVPAYKNATRLPSSDPSINIPSIPSIPISYQDALLLLKSLNGKGIKRLDKPGFREGGLGYLGVEYWTGPGEDTVELVNVMDDKVTPIWNTYAVIPGHLRDEVVILGNHNDACAFAFFRRFASPIACSRYVGLAGTFGAGDPNSGTASVHEIAKGLGVLLKQGWKPLRTIVLASWDAEEYGLIGSTEVRFVAFPARPQSAHCRRVFPVWRGLFELVARQGRGLSQRRR